MIGFAATAFGEFLAQSGAIAGGSIAWGVALGLIGGALATDYGLLVDRWELASRGGTLGALFGVSFVVAEGLW